MKNISIARPLAVLAALAVGAIAVAPAASAAEATAGQLGRLTIGSQRDAQDILARIRTDAASLRRIVADAAGASASAPAAGHDETLYRIDDLIQETDSLRDRVTRDVFVSSELDGLFRYALELDRANLGSRYGAAATTAWSRVRRDIDDLASAYNVDWNWERQPSGLFGSNRSTAVGGTYELSAADSDDPRAVVDRVLADVPAGRRARVERQIEDRLTPPDTIAIEQRGGTVTLASSTGPRVSIEADDQPRTETGSAGERVTTRAAAYGDRVEVTRSGSNGGDFTVTFEPLDNGRTMRVTRRLYTDDLQTPVTLRSLYHRTATTPDWGVYDDGRRVGAASRGGTIVPSGTTVVATLDQTIDGRTVHEGDRVTLTVTDGPAEVRNGVIEGYVTAYPERVNNRTGLSIDFDTIRLRNGREADFDGTIQNIRDPNGRDVGFDRPDADTSDRTEQAVQRGAVGAALGAVIGAVIGGGKGAAIGAAVGAGGGAGTVLIDDRTGQLARGTEFTIRSGSMDLR